MAKGKKDAAVPSDRPVVVRRERAEIYSVVGELERAKAHRAKLAARLAAFAGLEEEIKLADAQIARLGKRVAELTAPETLVVTGPPDRALRDREVGRVMATIIGVNRRTYPHPDFPGRGVDLVIALVSGSVGDYSAYIAGGRDEDYAAEHGDKLSFAEACIHFPGGLKEAHYRV